MQVSNLIMEKELSFQLNTTPNKDCTKCNFKKAISDFPKTGHWCKICVSEYKKRHYEQNKAKIAQHQKQYYEENKDKINIRNKAYKKAHELEVAIYQQQYKQEHKEELAAYKRDYHYRRLKEDIEYRIATMLRNRLNVAIKDDTKEGSAVSDLGCSIEDFKKYIETLFKSNMTWDNWGRGIGKWHLDHIIPLSSFDLTDRKQFLRAAHYTNYQPLWESDNLSKGVKIV